MRFRQNDVGGKSQNIVKYTHQTELIGAAYATAAAVAGLLGNTNFSNKNEAIAALVAPLVVGTVHIIRRELNTDNACGINKPCCESQPQDNSVEIKVSGSRNNTSVNVNERENSTDIFISVKR